MAVINPFTPGLVTSQMTASATSTSVAWNKPDSEQIMVTAPAGGAIVYIAFGTAAVVATATAGTPILPGTVQLFSVAPDQTNMAAITTASTQTLFVTPGHGI